MQSVKTGHDKNAGICITGRGWIEGAGGGGEWGWIEGGGGWIEGGGDGLSSG